MEQLFDSQRNIWVASQPEERVRHQFVRYLTDHLGYPPALLAVEKSLTQVPHLKGRKGLPSRRADLICFGKEIHPHHALYPLLLVECKAVKLTEKAFQQVTGYNHHLGAFFVAVVNEDSLQMGWREPGKEGYLWQEGLLPYSQLLAALPLREGEKAVSDEAF